VHIVSLSEASPGLSLGLLVPCLLLAILLNGVAVFRLNQSGYTPRSALFAIPRRRQGLLLLTLGYALLYFGPLVQEIAATGNATGGQFATVGSAIAIYMCLLSAFILELPPGSPQPGTQPNALPLGEFVDTPSVRLGTRAIAMHLGFIGGIFLVMPWVFEGGFSFGWAILGMLLLIVGLSGLSFLLLRCPRCRKLATRTPTGWSTAWVGSKCRWCGQPY